MCRFFMFASQIGFMKSTKIEIINEKRFSCVMREEKF
jgi:hypothetical protein